MWSLRPHGTSSSVVRVKLGVKSDKEGFYMLSSEPRCPGNSFMGVGRLSRVLIADVRVLPPVRQRDCLLTGSLPIRASTARVSRSPVKCAAPLLRQRSLV